VLLKDFWQHCLGQCFGSGSGLGVRIQMGQRILIVNPDPNSDRAKLSPKKGEKRNFMFEDYRDSVDMEDGRHAGI
jgi:hypothetical protein